MNKDENMMILHQSKAQLDDMTAKLSQLFNQRNTAQFTVPTLPKVESVTSAHHYQTKTLFANHESPLWQTNVPQKPSDSNFEQLMSMLTLQREKQRMELRMYTSKIEQQNLEIAALEQHWNELERQKIRKSRNK